MTFVSGIGTSTSDEPYWLGRASEEQQRLIEQHNLYLKSLGYILPSSILKILPENARIADVGTGTGIWLKDLAAMSPSTYHFDGFDISDGAFLPADAFPTNVKLGFLDFKKPVPEDLRGQFDLVNIRLIIIALGPLEAWKSTLSNVLTMLKPGGALCWTEGNFLVSRGYRGPSPSSTPGHALMAIQAQLNSTMIKRIGYSFPDLAALFSDGGLVDVETDIVSTDRFVELRRAFTECAVGACAAGLVNLSKSEILGRWSEEEVEQRRREAIQDMESGAYIRFDIHVAVGFTASSRRLST